MRFNPFLEWKRVQDARELVAATDEKFEEELSEHRAAYERFYNNPAIFSGGAIALSVNYLGYLKSVSQPVLYQHLLVASWVCFLLCLLFALSYSFFYTHYVHYARLREFNQNRQKQCQTELEEMPKLNMVGASSPAERKAYADKLQLALQEYGESAKWARRKESLYSFLWRRGGLAARLAFLTGMVLLVSFAVANI